MRFKHALACPRPIDYSPAIQPIIPVPGHGSLPSGHATEAFMVAHLLEILLPGGYEYRRYLQPLAFRTSINRTVAGVHFPIDSHAGRCLGQSLIEHFVYLASKGKQGGLKGWKAREFDGKKIAQDQKVDIADLDFEPWMPPPEGTEIEPSKAHFSPVLSWFWDRAASEWS